MTLKFIGTIQPENALQPEIAEFRDHMLRNAEKFPSLYDVDLSQGRENCEKIRKPFTDNAPDMSKVENLTIKLPNGSVNIRIYTPHKAQKNSPCLFYLHGGGWVLFSINTHDRLMREYAKRANIRVIGIDYGLAPEYKYPHQMNEITEVILHCLKNKNDFGLDNQNIFLGGDSAGANLSLAVMQSLKQNAQN